MEKRAHALPVLASSSQAYAERRVVIKKLPLFQVSYSKGTQGAEAAKERSTALGLSAGGDKNSDTRLRAHIGAHTGQTETTPRLDRTPFSSGRLAVGRPVDSL